MTQAESRSTHKFLRDRAILVGLPISDTLADDFEDALSQLNPAGGEPIMVYVNSPGGAVLASQRIMGRIADSKLEIRTCCLGRAAGSAAHIFALGCYRTAVADCLISFEHLTGGDFADSSQIEHLRGLFIDSTSRALGLPTATIARWISEERTFSGRDLITTGLVHSIL